MSAEISSSYNSNRVSFPGFKCNHCNTSVFIFIDEIKNSKKIFTFKLLCCKCYGINFRNSLTSFFFSPIKEKKHLPMHF